jgi:hypothetical protein
LTLRQKLDAAEAKLAALADRDRPRTLKLRIENLDELERRIAALKRSVAEIRSAVTITCARLSRVTDTIDDLLGETGETGDDEDDG